MRHFGIVVACVAALLLPTAQASAQIQFGPQVSVGTDSGLGLGARIGFPLRTDALGVDGVIDANYFFGGGNAIDSWIDTNINLRLPIPLAQDFVTRIGAGVNFTFISFDASGQTTDTDTDAGLNLLVAIQIPRDRVSPYFDLRAVLGGAEQVVLTGGFAFGPPR